MTKLKMFGACALIFGFIGQVTAAAGQIDPRVVEIRSRLSRTRAGQVLLRCLELHGLESYFKVKVISVLNRYPGRTPDSHQKVSTWGTVLGVTSIRTDAQSYTRSRYGSDRYFPLKDPEFLARNAPVALDLGSDGKQFWAVRNGVRSDDPGALRLARRDVLLWHFWNNTPFKFAEPNAKLEYKGEETIGNVVYQKVRIHWGEGIGETPDDWFILYVNKDTGLFEKLHFIVTGRVDKAILMSDWTDRIRVAGVLFPTRRTMYRSDLSAKYGEQTEQQELEQVRMFSTLNKSDFDPPPFPQ